MIYTSDDKTALQEFAALVLDYDKDTQIAKIYRKNYFKLGDTLEIFSLSPNNGKEFEVEQIWDNKGNAIEVANRSDEILTIKTPFEVKVNDILRTKKQYRHQLILFYFTFTYTKSTKQPLNIDEKWVAKVENESS